MLEQVATETLNAIERRSKLRIYKPFPITVQGLDTQGQAFEVQTVVQNMSTESVFFGINHSVKIGTRLSLTIRLSTVESEDISIAKIAVEGIVIRIEPQLNNQYGIAVIIIKHRFLK